MRVIFCQFFKVSRGQRGISLVEILVTLSILAILGGIALPSYQQYRKSTIRSAVKMELANGAKLYVIHQKLAGDFCADFDEVGFYPDMNSKIFETGGFVGFSNHTCDTAPGDIKDTSGSVTGPTGCTLDEEEFTMGAHTQVQGLTDLHTIEVDDEGKMTIEGDCGKSSLPTNCANPCPSSP